MALAGLWVAWIAWGFGISPPVSKEVPTAPGKTVTPGSVDTYVNQVVEGGIGPKILPKDSPENKIVLGNFVEDFRLALQSSQPRMFPHLAVNSPPPIGTPKSKGIKPPDVPVPPKGGALPEVVATVLNGVASGRSIVLLPLPVGAAGGADAAVGGAAARPAAAAVRPVMGDPAAAMGAGKADKSWVIVGGKFSQAEQEIKFKAANIPDFLLGTTLYVEVQLERQEIGEDGNPIGPARRIAPLPMNAPPFNRSVESQLEKFLDWMGANQATILQPVFYQIVGGDPMRMPDQPAPIVADNIRPDQPPAAWDVKQALIEYKAMKDNMAAKAEYMKKLTEAQRTALFKAYQEDQAKENEKNKPKTTTPPKTPPKSPGKKTDRGGTNDVSDPRIGRSMYRNAAGAPAPAITRAGNQQIDADGNIVVWAHDDSVEPGHSYRYRIRVVVKNPLFGQKADKKDPASVLALPVDNDAAWSEWSTAVRIPVNIKLQLAGAVLGKEQVKFNVLKRQPGSAGESSRSQQAFAAGVGDAIGGVDAKTGADYRTRWNVAEIRTVGSDTRVMMVSDDGRIEWRSAAEDQKNPEFVAPTGTGTIPGRPGY